MTSQPIFKSSQGRANIMDMYDALLSRWPVPCETHQIPTHEGSTFVIACGDPAAPPMILLHGSSSNSAMWIGDVRRFCARYRVYAIDLLGEPGRSEAVRAELNGPAYADWLLEIYKGLNIQHAVLAGISLGGWFALKFATAHADRVDQLILLCPSGIGPQRTSFMLRAIPMLLLGQWGIDRMIRFVNSDQSIPDEAVQYSKLIATHFNPRMGKIPVFTDAELSCLTMPTLLIVGEKDVLLDSMKSVRRLKSLHPLLTAVSLPNAGHVLINQTDRIMTFLGDHTNSSQL